MNRTGETIRSRLAKWWYYNKGFVCLIGFLVTFLSGMLFMAAVADYWSCMTRGNFTKQVTEWRFFGGCFHKRGDTWYLQGQQRFIKEME